MKKIVKLGLSAVAAFALMFTTTISVVAQEKVNGSDNVEVKESVEAMVLDQNSFTTTMWFQLSVDLLDQTDATKQILENQGTTNPACSSGETICEVELQYDESNPNIQAELARVTGSNPPSVSDLIAAGAIYTGDTEFDPVYTYHSE